ncbi:MAG: lysophospholipid acyltransferase family protein [Candidatus Brocadiia bacterium]
MSEGATDTALQRLGALLLHPYFAVAHRLAWSGAENIPEDGPAILAANHQSFFDPVLIGLAAGRPIIYMGTELYYRMPVVGWFMRLFDTVPVSEKAPGPSSISRLLRALDAGYLVGIFPEGGRTPDEQMMKPQEGVAALTLRTGCPVIPVTISGAWRAWPTGQPLPRPAPIGLHFGDPMRFSGTSTPDRRREVTFRVMMAVADGFRRLERPDLAAASEGRLRRWQKP